MATPAAPWHFAGGNKDTRPSFQNDSISSHPDICNLHMGWHHFKLSILYSQLSVLLVDDCQLCSVVASHLMKCHKSTDFLLNCHSALLTGAWCPVTLDMTTGGGGVTVVESSHSIATAGHRNNTTAVVAVINKACRHHARDNT